MEENKKDKMNKNKNYVKDNKSPMCNDGVCKIPENTYNFEKELDNSLINKNIMIKIK